MAHSRSQPPGSLWQPCPYIPLQQREARPASVTLQEAQPSQEGERAVLTCLWNSGLETALRASRGRQNRPHKCAGSGGRWGRRQRIMRKRNSYPVSDSCLSWPGTFLPLQFTSPRRGPAGLGQRAIWPGFLFPTVSSGVLSCTPPNLLFCKVDFPCTWRVSCSNYSRELLPTVMCDGKVGALPLGRWSASCSHWHSE